MKIEDIDLTKYDEIVESKVEYSTNTPIINKYNTEHFPLVRKDNYLNARFEAEYNTTGIHTWYLYDNSLINDIKLFLHEKVRYDSNESNRTFKLRSLGFTRTPNSIHYGDYEKYKNHYRKYFAQLKYYQSIYSLDFIDHCTLAVLLKNEQIKFYDSYNLTHEIPLVIAHNLLNFKILDCHYKPSENKQVDYTGKFDILDFNEFTGQYYFDIVNRKDIKQYDKFKPNRTPKYFICEISNKIFILAEIYGGYLIVDNFTFKSSDFYFDLPF